MANNMNSVISKITSNLGMNTENSAEQSKTVNEALRDAISNFNIAVDNLGAAAYRYNETYKEYLYQTTYDSGTIREKMKEKVIEVLNEQLE